MAVMASRPTPGHAKMVSVTTAPPRRKPYWSPTTVTTGISAFLRACLPTTLQGGTPLARAVVTYSRPSTSSMPERVSRLMMASDVVASVARSEEHTSELQSLAYLVCRLLLEKKKTNTTRTYSEKKKKTTC